MQRCVMSVVNMMLIMCSSVVSAQDESAQFSVIKTIVAESSEACNELCISEPKCISADYGSPSMNSGTVNGADFVANDRNCILYGKSVSAAAVQVAPPPPTPAPVGQEVREVPVVQAPPVVVRTQPIIMSGGGMQYQVYIKAAQCRFLSKGHECVYSTRGSIHLIFHGTMGTSQQDVVWKPNGLEAGTAATRTVVSDDVGVPTHVSFFVPGKDDFKPQMIIVNKMGDGIAPGSAGVYFTEDELLMTESLLEPYQMADSGRYYYRYPLYLSTCTKAYASLTDWFLKCRPNHSPTPAPQEYCGDIEMNQLQHNWMTEESPESDGGWRYYDVSLGGIPQALLIEVQVSGEYTLQVTLCPHCPKDGACMGVAYGQYAAYEDRNYMNLTRTSLGQRKMWTAVPPSLKGATYRVGVNDPDLVRMSNRWYVAVRAVTADYAAGDSQVYYKIRARFGMDACTSGPGTGALVNGRGKDDYASKMDSEYGKGPAAAATPAAVASAYRERARNLNARTLTMDEQRVWGLDASRRSPAGAQSRSRRLGSAAKAAKAAAPCGGTHPACTGSEFCNFDEPAKHLGSCVACSELTADEHVEKLSEMGRTAWQHRCTGGGGGGGLGGGGPPAAKQAEEQEHHEEKPPAARAGGASAGPSECGVGHSPCAGTGLFCNFARTSTGVCQPCAEGAEEAKQNRLTPKGHIAFGMKCSGHANEHESGGSHLGGMVAAEPPPQPHAVAPQQPHHASAARASGEHQCGGSFPACTTGFFCNFDSGNMGMCKECSATSEADVQSDGTELGKRAYHARCSAAGGAGNGAGAALGGGKTDDDTAAEDDDKASKAAPCGGKFAACTGHSYCNFDSGDTGTCQSCGQDADCSKSASLIEHHACVARCSPACGRSKPCAMMSGMAGATKASPTFCNFHSADAGTCQLCSSVPPGGMPQLSSLAQAAFGHKCAAGSEGAGAGAALGGAFEPTTNSLNPYAGTGSLAGAIQCGGPGMSACASGQFCTYHTDGMTGVCRLCSTLPDCAKAMGARGQADCTANCNTEGTQYNTQGRYAQRSEGYGQKEEAEEAEEYAEKQADEYDKQQEQAQEYQEQPPVEVAAEAQYSTAEMQYKHDQQEAAKAYEQKQTEYESVHNEPYACPLYVDYPTLDVNLGSHGQRPAVVDPYTEQCPGIDEAWCKQTHYMCDANNYGLAMKPAPAICTAMAEGWDSYGQPFGCAALSYPTQSLIYEVVCDLGPGPQLYGMANAESSSPNLVAKSNFGYQYTFPRYETPPVPCEPVHFACETPECYLSARPLGCMCHPHRVPECQMVDDDAWVRYRAMGYVHSNAYHVNHKEAVVAPPTYAAAGAKSYGVRGKTAYKKEY